VPILPVRECVRSRERVYTSREPLPATSCLLNAEHRRYRGLSERVPVHSRRRVHLSILQLSSQLDVTVEMRVPLSLFDCMLSQMDPVMNCHI
jgi:hypothetical protein